MSSIDADRLAAIDVHVHLEHPGDSDTQDAAKKYFKDSGVPRDEAGLADYYRSRRMACVIFGSDTLADVDSGVAAAARVTTTVTW